MRVLHLVKTAVGAQWALRQMRELAGLGIDVHVAMPDGPLTAAYAAAGVTVHTGQFELPVRQPWALAARGERFRRLVAELQPDLLHSHFVSTTLAMRLALGRHHPVPRVFQVPGPLHLEHRFVRRGEIATAGAPDYWIASCRWTQWCYVNSGVSASRTFLAYYGTDIDALASARPGRLRDELGLAPTTKIIGMVAFMYAPRLWLGQRRGLKGHEDLIDAAALCVSHGADVVCVFVGGPWNGARAYERRIRAYAAARLGRRAVFLGTRSDVAQMYADFDLAVHPSHSENVGGAAESLLAGVPTIATRTGGFPDVVAHGETGWLVPPRDPRRLAAAILEALSDRARARALAAAGQRRARRLLDVRRNARDVAAIYETIRSRRDVTGAGS